MKASVSARIFPITILCGFFAAGFPLVAQDAILLKNGQRREAKILAVDGDRLKFKAGPVESTLPLDQVQSVEMVSPKAFEQALALWQSGNATETIKVLQPLVQSFRRLPSPWAQRASALLGEVLISVGDIPGAEAAFAAFQKAYPEATGLSELGLARIALEKGDLATAGQKAAPVATEARKTLLADSSKSAEYGQALYIMGVVEEKNGNLPAALDNYLMVTTVFFADAAIAGKARASADDLIKKNVSVP